MHVNEEKWEDVKFEEALEIAGYGKFSMFIIFLSGLAICSSFLSSLDISFLLPAAECDLNLTSQNKGLLSSAYFFGIIVASHLSGFLADTFGRRYVLVRGLWINVIIYILGSVAPEFWSFFILKFFSGVVLCPCMIATFPLLGEYLPAKKRSQALLITTSISTLGLLYSSLVGWVTLQEVWSLDLWFVTFTPWRLFYLLCVIPSLFSAILFNFTPESPKFLLTRGKKGDTMKVLQRVHSVNSGKLPQSFPVASVSMDADDTVPPAREKGAAGMLKHVCDQTLPLFSPPYFLNLLLCVVLFFNTFLCVNSIFLWLPEVTNRIATYKELNEGKFYLCQMLMKESMANVTTDIGMVGECNATINTAVFVPNLLLAVAQPTVMLLSSFIVPYIDRRVIIMIIMILCSVMSFAVTRIADASIIIILFGGVAIFVGICFNIITGILIELFPTYIRAMAVSFSMICGRLGSIVGSYMFSQLIDSRCSLLFHLIAGLLMYSM